MFENNVFFDRWAFAEERKCESRMQMYKKCRIHKAFLVFIFQQPLKMGRSLIEVVLGRWVSRMRGWGRYFFCENKMPQEEEKLIEKGYFRTLYT